MEEKGKLPETILKNIYNLILKSKNISMKVKQDVHYNYNLEGITGLKKPKRKWKVFSVANKFFINVINDHLKRLTILKYSRNRG